jgi:hypothetical protein
VTQVEDTWARRELPILLAAYRRVESGEGRSVHQLEQMRQELGMSARDFQLGLEALANADPPYIEVRFAAGWSEEKAGGGLIDGITERGRRELGGWPTANTLVDQLVAALNAAADAEAEPDRKSRLREAAETLGSTGYRIAVDVATKWVEHKSGV